MQRTRVPPLDFCGVRFVCGVVLPKKTLTPPNVSALLFYLNGSRVDQTRFREISGTEFFVVVVASFERWFSHAASQVSGGPNWSSTNRRVFHRAACQASHLLCTVLRAFHAIQVGALKFKAMEMLGEVDMRDTESIRIDRAEM